MADGRDGMHADLYYGRIDLRRHLPQPGPACRACDAASCRSFAARLEDGRLAEEARRGPLPPEACPLLTRDRLHAFRIALAPELLLPAVDVSPLPRPVEAGAVPIANPGPGAPVLVSANHEGTVAFLGALLAWTSTPLHYLIVDTGGDGVDMAMILGSLTAERIAGALRTVFPGALPERIVLPGLAAALTEELAAALAEELAAALAGELAARTGRRVEVGPVCGAELPLFLGEAWRAAPGTTVE